MTVLVVKSGELKATETFIGAHVAALGAGARLHTLSRGPAAARLRRLLDPVGLGRVVPLPEARGLLRRHRPAVVLAEYGPTGADVWRACRAAGVPLVVHFHGYDASAGHVLRRYRAEYRHLFGFASAVVAVSQPMMQALQGLGAPADRLHLVPCGVDVGAIAATVPSRNAPHFVGIGRFVEKKGQLHSIAAFAKVLAEVPEASLTLVGDGPMLAAARQSAAGLGVDGAVRFTGGLPHSEVLEVLGTARALVHHSVTAAGGDMEGTPVALLEAMATGLPVVATRHGGIPEAVHDGESGYLVDEGDVDGMATGMLRLAEAGDDADRMGSHARAQVGARYDVRVTGARLREIVAGCLPATKPGAPARSPTRCPPGR